MSIGQAIQDYRKANNLSQQDIAEKLPIDRSVLSRIEKGERNAPKDVMRRVTTQFDDPQLYIAAQEEVTGGACTPWLNNVDLHRATTHLKTLEEIEEAVQAMRKAPITKRSDQLDENEREMIRKAIMECIEAITALTHHVAVLCKEYCFSWLQMWKEHRAKLKAHKYLK